MFFLIMGSFVRKGKIVEKGNKKPKFLDSEQTFQGTIGGFKNEENFEGLKELFFFFCKYEIQKIG